MAGLRELTAEQKTIFAEGCVRLKHFRQNHTSPIGEADIWSETIYQIMMVDDPEAAQQFRQLAMPEKQKIASQGVISLEYFISVAKFLRP